VQLIDEVEGKTIDLLTQESYTFTTTGEEKGNTTRFRLIINPDEIIPGPMVVAGKVRINGEMRSKDAVHVFASADTGKVYIDNSASALLMTDTIIFYSNDTHDGLLQSQKNGGVKGISNPNQPKKVIVRKNLQSTKWTYITIPFDVKMSDLSRYGAPLVGAQDYWFAKFDAHARSQSSKTDPNIVAVFYRRRLQR
jgi:hypothetical protein